MSYMQAVLLISLLITAATFATLHDIVSYLGEAITETIREIT